MKASTYDDKFKDMKLKSEPTINGKVGIDSIVELLQYYIPEDWDEKEVNNIVFNQNMLVSFFVDAQLYVPEERRNT